MKFLIAPDSFKGSLTAQDAAEAIQAGLMRVFPRADYCLHPMADGGEGTLFLLIRATQGQLHKHTVRGPSGRDVKARWGVLGDGKTAVVESAEAIGLPLVPISERDPWQLTSYGLGQLIRHVVDKGFKKVIITLGGSATVDGGLGALDALGAEFRAPTSLPLQATPVHMEKFESVDFAKLESMVEEVEFILALDVTNPLCGPKGALRVFGPQKGLKDEDLERFETAIEKLGGCYEDASGLELVDRPGSGAAGGLATALGAALRADFVSGVQLVARETYFDESMQGASIIITGEGKVDSQSGDGKVIGEIARRSAGLGVPVVAFAAEMGENLEELRKKGVGPIFSCVPGVRTLGTSLARAKDYLTDLAENFGRTLKIGTGL